MSKRLLAALLSFWLLAACQNKPTTQTFDAAVKKLGARYAPDASLALFKAQLHKNNNGDWVLRGETNLPQAAGALIAFTDSLLGADTYTDSLTLLPQAQLGDSTLAIVRVSVAHLRRAPRHSAELVDQAIMGRVLRLLKKDGGWYFVQTPYGYLGWMNKSSFVRTDSAGAAAFENSDLLRVNAFNAMIYSAPSTSAPPVSDAVFNMRLIKKGQKGRWVEVQLPDGRNGYMPASALKEAARYAPADGARIVETARKMLGVPYLWGGNSNKGNDCSGFTQNVFLAHGIQLPRDARQQALKGEAVEPGADFSNLRPGDLLFFGKPGKITHVGISLGGARYIHQAGDVHISSFDPRDKEYSADRRKSFQFARRVLK